MINSLKQLRWNTTPPLHRVSGCRDGAAGVKRLAT